jgi:hypothetical protein
LVLNGSDVVLGASAWLGWFWNASGWFLVVLCGSVGFWVVLVWFWDGSGVIPGWFWDDSRVVLGWFWG